MNILISKNFTIEEVQHSSYAFENGLDNVLPSIYYMNAINLANYILEPLRLKYGAFSPLSWYRGESVNKGVGGSPNSDHMTASAVDIRIKGVTPLELAEYIRDDLSFDQLILEPTWVHVSHKQFNNNRMQVLTKIGNEYKKGLITCS